MKRFILTACAGLLAATMATPSFAADLPRPAYKAPAYVAPVWTWSGFYVGVNGGYGFGNADFGAADVDTRGWLGGGTVGFNLQTGSWVWGVEGDFDYSTISGECGGGACSTRLNWLATARGRIGYAFDRFLPYFTGGAAISEVRMRPAGGPVSHDTQVGWTVGGGLEWAFLGNLSAKIEYLYVDLGSAECTGGACGGGVDVDHTTHLIRAGLNYRF
jgi:outer membrane immunogenic protein